MSNTHSLSTMFYETVESKEINVAYAGKSIEELYDMTDGFLAICRAGLAGNLPCVDADEHGLYLVFIATLEGMKRRLAELFPMDKGEPVMREISR